MCGILFYNTNNVKKGNKKIGEVFSSMKHRGPDNTTIKIIDKMLFCHHRLALINSSSSSGEQPIIKDDIVLIANGEIYNYKQISDTKNDCESIITLYKKNKLCDLDGDFAFVLYDRTKRVIVTGRDPVGLKPLYIGYSDSIPIAFSSEMKALSIIDSINSVKEHPINMFNLYNIDSNGNIVPEQTKCIINYETLIVSQKYENALKNIRILLDNAVKKRIDHTDKPFAFLCSGGIDSVIIVSIAAKLGIPMHIFTLSVESSFSYDEIYADMYINELKNTYKDVQYTKVNFSIEEGISTIEEVIKNLESYDPNTIRASIPMYLLAKYIKNNTDYKVIISGEGSDELFMGYNYFSIKNPTNEQAEKESLRLINGLHSFDILRAERCFSCHGLELRVPFLDKELISTVIQIPGEYRLPKNGIEKYILREAYKDMSIPDKILYRQKERMSDGIGFTWVPSLINHCCKVTDKVTDNDKTETRMKNEKEYYINIYNKYYKYNTIIFRELPDWALSEKVNILEN